ncbi:MAG: hypothetical protein AAGC80_31780 [Rhodococcus sp. (in: high G+C Gram-positive bacteria)]
MSYIRVNGIRIDVPFNIALDLVDRMAASTHGDCVIIEWGSETPRAHRVYIPHDAVVETVADPDPDFGAAATSLAVKEYRVSADDRHSPQVAATTESLAPSDQ